MSGLEYGYAGSEQETWCLRIERAELTLCGLEAGFFPIHQPTDPSPVCASCDAISRYEECPACHLPAPVEGGRIRKHGDGFCVGINMFPAGTSARGPQRPDVR